MTRPAEFWQAMPGDVLRAPFWPWPVTVEAATPLDDRFALVHWTSPGMSGVSRLSQHALVTVIQSWQPGLCGRYAPRQVPAAAAVTDAARAQYLAGITRRPASDRLVRKWALESDMAALSRGESRTSQPCGCNR